MKKTVLLTMVLIVLIGILTGCNNDEEKEQLLLCRNGIDTYVLGFENDSVNRIYYKKVFDFNVQYTDWEIEDIHNNINLLTKIIKEHIKDCNNEKYSCSSSYKNNVITNEIYVKNFEEANKANLDKYYGINSTDVRTLIVSNEKVTCEYIDASNEYVINNTSTTIELDNTYNSIDEMLYDINKPVYYKTYNLVELNGKIGTIEFKDNNECDIDLSAFDMDYTNNSYCDSNNKQRYYHKYNKGTCTYEIKNNIFTITYDGTVESGQYCGSKDNKTIYDTKSIIYDKSNTIIIEFDSEYKAFKYNNGLWKKKLEISPLLFTYK